MAERYSFSSEIEPSEKQLEELMKAVSIEVKEKAEKANKQFWENLDKEIELQKIKHPNLCKNNQN